MKKKTKNKRLTPTKEKSTQLIQKQQVKQTPFTLIKTNEKVKITAGTNIVSAKEFDTFEQARKYIYSKPYELLITTTAILVQEMSNQQNNK